jgi:hypothetical protein
LHIFYTSWRDSFSHTVLLKTFVLLSFVTYWVGEGRAGGGEFVLPGLASQAGRVNFKLRFDVVVAGSLWYERLILVGGVHV